MTARVQENRTATPNAPPANNSLQVGELFVEMATPLRLWTGVPTTVTASGVKLIVDATAQAAANAGFVQKAGDTMAGPLVLSGAPTAPAQAANKAYVDGLVPNLTPYAPINSPTFTGDPKAPTPALGDVDTSIATTAFVANTIAAGPPAGAIIALNPPTVPAPIPGTLWWDSTGGQLYVRYDDGNSQQWVTAANMEGLANAATKQDVAALSANVGRNLIHNPLFNVAQRGVGPFTADGNFTADRWSISITSDTVSISPQSTLGDADRAGIGDEEAKFQLVNVFTGNAAAGSFNLLSQRIENVRRLAGKTVTFSFWAKASGTQKLGINLTQIFGTGGSPSGANRVLATGNSVTLSTAWARYSSTIAVPSVSGKTLGTNSNDCNQLEFWFSSGATSNAAAGNIGVQSGTIQLWGVQLEVGSVATPLEKPDPRYDLSNCQRFYQQFIGRLDAYNVAGGITGWSVALMVVMRALPTAAVNFTGSANNTGSTVSPLTQGSIQIYSTAVATGNVVTNVFTTLSADL